MVSNFSTITVYTKSNIKSSELERYEPIQGNSKPTTVCVLNNAHQQATVLHSTGNQAIKVA